MITIIKLIKKYIFLYSIHQLLKKKALLRDEFNKGITLKTQLKLFARG